MADFTGMNSVTWQVDNTWQGMTRLGLQPGLTKSLIWYNNKQRTFSPEKTYLFKTLVNNFNYNLGNAYKKLELVTLWDTFTYSVSIGNVFSKLPISNDSNVYLTYYSKPTNIINSWYPVSFRATYNGFGTSSSSSTASVIKSIDIIEFDWYGQGWSLGTSSTFTNRYQGWSYNDGTFTFTRYNNLVSKSGDWTRRNPYDGYTFTNYIAKYVPYDVFNLSFDYSESGSPGYSYVDLYLVDSISSLTTTNLLAFTTSLSFGQYIGRIGTGGFPQTNLQFYNLTGNKYILFCANWENSGPFTITTNGYQFNLSNIQITGGYNETDNNEQFLFTNSNQYYSPTTLNLINGSFDATYSSITTTPQTLHYDGTQYFGSTGNPGYFSSLYGTVSNLSEQNSKIGNGTFRAGVWENGVWNSGLRIDDQVYEFNDIVAAFTTTTKNYKWRIQISGSTQSVEKFNVGDRVSISNIVSININGERKLIKSYYTVILKDESNIVVEVENNFPIRRVEKDSDNHKIKVTKNVWLSGAFLNGYFEGIWNSGLFKGYPYISEMYNTHWIDGTFDGGHFNSDYTFYDFIDTIYTNGYVGLSFSADTPHNLLTGDLIVIDKEDKSLNPQYDGTASIIEIVDEYFIVTDKYWGVNSASESGIVRKFSSSSLLQNVNFSDNNVAPKNAKQSQVLRDIWKFNSWFDLNFVTHSTTTINRNRIYQNENPINALQAFSSYKFGVGEFSPPNLYGFISEDVLSSKSNFRDIDSFNKIEYSLGTKYEIFTDFLGEISEFNKPFTSDASSSISMNNFFAEGWTYSYSGTFSIAFPPEPIPIGFTISRTTNGTVKIEFPNSSLSTLSFDNTNINIDRKRYSLVEFDIVSNGTVDSVYGAGYLNFAPTVNLFNFPFFVDDNGVYTGNNAFPVSEQQNYLYSSRTPVRSYFYNKNGLDLSLIGFPGFYFELDNIKFYEVDSIPFFQYTTEDYINKQVQVPYQARAPFIDYTNLNFSFVDNITFGFDSISINASSIPTTQAGINNGIAYNS